MSNLTGKIEHVVVAMLETRGFDTVLGHLYGGDGLPDHEMPPGDGSSFRRRRDAGQIGADQHGHASR